VATPALAWGRPHPTPSPSPTPIADPAVTAIARRQFVEWQAGKLDKDAYSGSIQSQLTDANVDKSSRALGTLGALTDVIYIGPLAIPDTLPDSRGYIYQMDCVGGKVYLFMVLDAQEKVERIFFKDKLETETITETPSPSPQPT